MKNVRIFCAALLIILGLAMIPAAFALTKKQKAAWDKCDREGAACFSRCEALYRESHFKPTYDSCNRTCNDALVECHNKVAKIVNTGTTRPSEGAPHGQMVASTPSPTRMGKAPRGQMMQSTPTPTPHQKSGGNKEKSGG
jgi:hypothetical protein